MYELTAEFMVLLGVNRAFAILIMFQLVCLVIAAPLIIFMAVRLRFHAMHFDVLAADVKEAKREAIRSADRAHESLITINKIIEPKS